MKERGEREKESSERERRDRVSFYLLHYQKNQKMTSSSFMSHVPVLFSPLSWRSSTPHITYGSQRQLKKKKTRIAREVHHGQCGKQRRSGGSCCFWCWTTTAHPTRYAVSQAKKKKERQAVCSALVFLFAVVRYFLFFFFLLFFLYYSIPAYPWTEGSLHHVASHRHLWRPYAVLHILVFSLI